MFQAHVTQPQTHETGSAVIRFHERRDLQKAYTTQLCGFRICPRALHRTAYRDALDIKSYVGFALVYS